MTDQPIASTQIVREGMPLVTVNILNRSSVELMGYILPPKFDGKNYVVDVVVSDLKSGAVGES